MSYSEVVEEAGEFRVRLELDEDAQNPREDGDGFLAGVVTLYGDRYIDVADPSGDHRVDTAWARLNERYRWREAAPILERYIGILGGVSELDTPNDGPVSLWYVLPDKWAEQTQSAWDADKAREALNAERQEYRSWADGEVYFYVVEQRMTWNRIDGDGVEVTMNTWEVVDSCGGFIGQEYAEQAAREALASYTEVPV